MVDRNNQNPKSGRRKSRKTSPKENDEAQDDLESEILGPYQLIFLMESTPNSTRYIDIYKDAMDHSAAEDVQECHSTIIIDYNQLVESLENTCADGKDDTYKLLHERNKNYFQKNGQMSTKLMVQLVRQSIVIALESMRHWCSNPEEDDDENVENNQFQPKFISIVLINFFDLAFIIEFINTNIKVDAIVELSCGKIAQIRDRFVPRASRVKRCLADKVIGQFWQDFHNGSNIASVFKDIMFYSYESKYNAFSEPPNHDKIVSTSRAYVMREMNKVQNFLFNARIGFENFIKSARPTYSLPVDGDYTQCFELYKKNLDVYPEQVLIVPIILDAMMNALEPVSRGTTDGEWVENFFNALRDENNSDDGCMSYPICVQYENECAQTVKKHNLRRTDYLKCAVSVMNTRWKTLLWASRPQMAFETETEYDNIISGVKRQCAAGGIVDVDMQLCVLALNRLHSNLDLFRGETIGLPGLGMTNVAFRPALIEPVGCATMVQMLEKESARRRRTSYAYFEPEDVVLIGFYDFAQRVVTRKSTFGFATPQRPVRARDYFDCFRGKRTPECFYAMQRPDAAAYSPCLAYTERTEEMLFRGGDCLTVTHSKWRSGRPGATTLRLAYKSKRFEIVRHVANAAVDDDDDRFRILTGTGCEHCVFRGSSSRDGAVGFVGKTADGAEIVLETAGGGAASRVLLRQSVPNTKAVHGGGPRRTEKCRRYQPGCVTVEYSDNTAVSYWASGKVTMTNLTAAVVGVPAANISGNSGGAAAVQTSKTRINDLEARNSIMTKPSRMSRASNAAAARNNSILMKPSRYSRSNGNAEKNNSIMSKPSRTSRNNGNAEKKSLVGRQDGARRESYGRRVDEDDGRTSLLLAEYHSDGGARKTVEFADGTRISTYVREVPDEPGWVCVVVSGHKYAHPAYRTVTDGRGHDGGPCVSVTDLVSLSAAVDGCEIVLRLPDSGRVVANGDAVCLYGPAAGTMTTFGWNNKTAVACSLFEKRDGRGDVTTVTYDRGTDELRVSRDTAAAIAASWTGADAGIAPPVQYFVVKRDMSGFALFGCGSDEHQLLLRGPATGRAVAVHESRDAKHVVALFADDRDCGGRDEPAPRVAEAAGRGYEWLQVRFPATRVEPRDAIPRLLSSRTFTNASADTDQYGAVATALRDTTAGRSSESGIIVATGARNNPAGPGKLAVRLYVPSTADSVTAIMVGDRECAHSGGPSLPRYESNSAAAAKRDDGHVLEARTRMRSNSFIPYFRAQSYVPLRDRLYRSNIMFPL